ncbi:RNA 3'-terminal phosphate cyclase [Halorussus salinus]|uniref:RNA 3'-terminal phosphate cyclase n=1 Tax=Halorussus salinus TaxID=1364935 RepID=UPI00109271D6|nr:RNA 3'-terminal phosphate cyclase [Halorussus salinus]
MTENADDRLLELDGAAGGGQLVRTALALSMVADEPFRMTNVRGDRPTPGLKPQHLAAVRAAAEVCDAAVEGAEQGAEELTFRPGSPTGGERESAERESRRTTFDGGRVEVDIGTAGSATLLFDALLPVAVALDRPLAVTATGGTDVKWSPSMAHYRRVKLPLVREAGLLATVECDRTGFFPAGGGEATLWLAPAARSDLTALDLTAPGDLRGVRVRSKESADLADADVAARQAASARERLRAGDGATVPDEVSVTEETHSSVATSSPGSALAVVLDYEETTVGFDALGEKGKPAEAVGREAAARAVEFRRRVEEYDSAAVAPAVDAHTADQLVVVLALAGGRVAIPAVTGHVRTCVDLVGEFGFEVRIEEDGDGPPVLTAPSGGD